MKAKTKGHGINQSGHLFERSGSWLGRFWATAKDGGKRERVTYHLGRSEELTPKQARQKLREIIKKSCRVSRAMEALAGEVAHSQSKRTSRAPAIIGALSELLVCVDLLSKGFNVYRSMDAQAACDLVAIRDDQMLRVEVKTEGPRIKLKTKRGKFDILAVVSSSNQIRYLAYADLPDFDTIRISQMAQALRATKETPILDTSRSEDLKNLENTGDSSEVLQ